MSFQRFRALGLMSGTSLDAIDIALIETDGHDYVRPLGFYSESFGPSFRERIRKCLGNREGTDDFDVALVERELTEMHALVVKHFLDQFYWSPDDIDLIGFHGQTIFHRPTEGVTIQIGDGELLADRTGIPVVNDFRKADVKAGGQGAPLVPVYHRALVANIEKPVAIINIGGVSNITWVGGDGDEELIAFDMGPGNALIDDWVWKQTGETYDKDGELAAQGRVDEGYVHRFIEHAYFNKKPPKSLDRDTFKEYVPEHLNTLDGVATLTMMTVQAIAEGLRQLPHKSRKLYLTGGGRHNATMRRWIADKTGLDVELVDLLGWNGDAMEAEAFAYLAVRSKLGLPLSVPGTTGVPMPMTGGVYFEPVREISDKVAAV